jgi:hypothetical protein
MKRMMTSVGLALASVVLFAGASLAAPPAAAERLATARKSLRSVEAALKIIEGEKVLTPETAAAFDGGLSKYAEGVFGAYTTLMSDAQLAAKSEGAEGNVEYMRTFEKELEVDHVRILRVQEQVKLVQADVQSGAVMLDIALLEKLSPAELSDFASYIDKGALQKYREAYPYLQFPDWSLSAHLFPNGVGAFAKDVYAHACSVPGKVEDALMPPVEAAIAWPCVSPCANQKWGQCVTCVLTAIPSGYEAWNSFLTCWNGSGKPWWVAGWLWKTGCVLAFVARIA